VKPNENQAKQSWKPMQLSCVARVGEVVESAGAPKAFESAVQATPPNGEEDAASAFLK
jgi:hypothetical protein